MASLLQILRFVLGFMLAVVDVTHLTYALFFSKPLLSFSVVRLLLNQFHVQFSRHHGCGQAHVEFKSISGKLEDPTSG
jgi:hypothetical protein